MISLSIKVAAAGYGIPERGREYFWKGRIARIARAVRRSEERIPPPHLGGHERKERKDGILGSGLAKLRAINHNWCMNHVAGAAGALTDPPDAVNSPARVF
jgi:hypothetical protein